MHRSARVFLFLVASWEPELAADDERESTSELGGDTGIGGILTVAASQRAVVDEQVAALGLDDRFDLAVIEISVSEAVNGIATDSTARLTRVIAGGGVAVLKLGKLDTGASQIDSSELQSMAGTIVNNLGKAVRSITDEANSSALIVIGGNTASGVLNACDVRSIRLQDEFSPVR